MGLPAEVRAMTAGMTWKEKRPSIRAVSPPDWDGWRALWLAYQEFYKATISDADTLVTWARFHDPAEPMFCAVSLDNQDEIVGFVHWVLHRSSWTAGAYCYLQDLFVAPLAREQGRGRELIEHVYDQAKVNDCSRVYWLTHEDNSTAMLLYNRVAVRSGFVQYRHLLAGRS